MGHLIVVGAGAAGLMAAGAALEQGHTVTLLEHEEKPGKKILVTGKGRCNVTNDCDLETFLQNVRTNPRFLYSAFSAFDTAAAMALFEGLGVPLKVERGRRVFPVSDRAEDILTRARAAGARAMRWPGRPATPCARRCPAWSAWWPKGASAAG